MKYKSYDTIVVCRYEVGYDLPYKTSAIITYEH